jgi:hypothetical protein
MPGVITIPAETPEEAEKILKEMAKDMLNVQIIHIVDAEQLPKFEQDVMAMQNVHDAAVEDELMEYPAGANLPIKPN